MNSRWTSLSPRVAMWGATLGASIVVVVAVIPDRPVLMLAPALLGLWLVVASIIGLIAPRAIPSGRRARWIPIAFSGSLGRFRVRPRGDGRHVEVVAGSEVVARAVASDDGDELMIEAEAVADSELEAFGASLGLAIEMASVADEDRPVERHRAGPSGWRRTTTHRA